MKQFGSWSLVLTALIVLLVLGTAIGISTLRNQRVKQFAQEALDLSDTDISKAAERASLVKEMGGEDWKIKYVLGYNAYKHHTKEASAYINSAIEMNADAIKQRAEVFADKALDLTKTDLRLADEQASVADFMKLKTWKTHYVHGQYAMLRHNDDEAISHMEASKELAPEMEMRPRRDLAVLYDQKATGQKEISSPVKVVAPEFILKAIAEYKYLIEFDTDWKQNEPGRFASMQKRLDALETLRKLRR